MSGIVETDGVLGRKPRIEGTRVSAEQVYEMYMAGGMSRAEIADVLPSVARSAVKTAIDFVGKERDDPSEHQSH